MIYLFFYLSIYLNTTLSLSLSLSFFLSLSLVYLDYSLSLFLSKPPLSKLNGSKISLSFSLSTPPPLSSFPCHFPFLSALQNPPPRFLSNELIRIKPPPPLCPFAYLSLSLSNVKFFSRFSLSLSLPPSVIQNIIKKKFFEISPKMIFIPHLCFPFHISLILALKFTHPLISNSHTKHHITELFKNQPSCLD